VKDKEHYNYFFTVMLLQLSQIKRFMFICIRLSNVSSCSIVNCIVDSYCKEGNGKNNYEDIICS